MRGYIGVLSILLGGCSANGDPVPTMEQTHALVFTHSAWNGVTNLPPSSTHFCHPTALIGDRAHSQSLVLPWGVPYCGGRVTVAQNAWPGSNTLAAIPNQCEPASTRQGDMIAYAQCDPWSADGLSGEFVHQFGPPAVLESVSASSLLWDVQSACFLAGVGDMSVPAEKAYLDVPNGWNWQLNTIGFRSMYSAARCAWLGHAVAYTQWLTADITTGNTAYSSVSVTQGTCLVYHIEGSLDDGFWALVDNNGAYKLNIGGSISRAKAYCFDK